MLVTESSQAEGNHEDNSGEVDLNGHDALEAEPVEAPYPPLRSEDSGLGLSASPSEQHLLPAQTAPDSLSGTEGVWRKGGTIENMSRCLQDILASVITR